MLKGFFALITTGLLLNPAVFFGGLFGIIAYIKLDEEKLKLLCVNLHLYLLFFLLMFLFVYFFRKTLKDDCIHIDWKATLQTVLKQFLIMSFSFYMGILIGSYFDFSLPAPSKEDYQYSEYSEMTNLLKQAEDIIKIDNKILDTLQ
ncbi:MAG: hypothetical protein IJ870_02615 [Alphaproteobacteria bacterium]|nr:hypothetical protein [Alphaproteobacteria bacterium]